MQLCVPGFEVAVLGCCAGNEMTGGGWDNGGVDGVHEGLLDEGGEGDVGGGVAEPEHGAGAGEVGCELIQWVALAGGEDWEVRCKGE